MKTIETKRKSAYLIYPIFCIGPMLLSAGLLIHDKSFWKFAPMIYLITLVAVQGLERLFPWSEDWNASHADRLLDLKYLLSNFAISHGALLLYGLIFNVRENATSLGLQTSPIWIQLTIGLLVFDFGLYVMHRLSHRYGFLWKLHAIHHSSERIYSVNGQKRHLLHEILEGAPGFMALFLAGIRPEVAVVIIALVSLHLLFQHANIEYRAGFLRHFFSVAEVHRWHHQRDWHAVQGNYGAVLSIWDSFFRTGLKQIGTPPARVGLDESPHLHEMGFVEQQRWPFETR